MSSDYQLNDEEKNILQRHKQLAEMERQKGDFFWRDEYVNYSIEKKVQYWLANIHHGMRQQGEAIGDNYTEFSKEWYLLVKEREPDFDFILKDVVLKLGFDFDWKEYHKRISEPFFLLLFVSVFGIKAKNLTLRGG